MAKESLEVRKRRAGRIIAILNRTYPDARCSLDHANPLELLVATILSAQCTDQRVNICTKDLFKKYRTPKDYSAAPAGQLEQDIRSTGFYNNKAKALRGSAGMIERDFGGKVPDEMDKLLTLPGVARKTANVVLGTAYGKNEGFVVDTHVLRVSGRLKLTESDKPGVVEQDMMKVVPRSQWTHFGHVLIYHGRAICTARRPDCAGCPVNKLCPSAFKVG